MKKSINNLRESAIQNAIKEFQGIAGLKDLHGIHSTVWSFITTLMDVGVDIDRLRRYETTLPDIEEE